MKNEYRPAIRAFDALPAAQVRVPGRNKSLVRLILSHPAVLILVDLGLGALAYLLAWFISTSVSLPFTRDIIPEEQWNMVGHPVLTLAACQVLLPYLFGLHDELRRTRYRELVTFLAMVCALQIPAVTSILFLTDSPFPRKVLVLFAALNFVFLVVWRFYVKAQIKRHSLRVIVVGERPESTDEIIHDIENSPWMGMTIIGLVFSHEQPQVNRHAGYSVLGTLNEVDSIISHYGVEEIILASEPTWKDRVLNSISRMQAETAVKINILPSVYEMVIGKLRHINIHDTPLISVRRNPNEPFQRFVKRSFDLVFSALCLILLLPIFLIVGLMIRLTSRGPSFYLQDRVGYGGRNFRLIKFRTMVRDAERSGNEELARVNDPRVTAVGRVLRRFRIDEIPQLINVLKGDMSFVGPRPERPGFVTEFQKTVPGYSERLKIKPGITGLAQVRGFYHTSAESKLKYDLAYIYNYSFSLDFFLLLETVKVVLTRRGS